MPLITASHDSLPYIDRPPTPTSTARAHALITASLPSSANTTPHPLLPPSPRPKFSPLVLSELDRIASHTPLTAIDLTRYEATPSLTDSPTDSPLSAAYTNATYLTLRHQSLELLSQFGKNAWLVGNAQLEEILRGIERELVETRERTEVVNRERRGKQEAGRGALEGGEREWREGVGRVLDVEMGRREVEEEWRERLRGKGLDRGG